METAEAWEQVLGLPPGSFLTALFNGNDETALVGKIPEESWWEQVRYRLGVTPERLREIRADLLAKATVDSVLLDGLARLRPAVRLCLVSNAWSGTREILSSIGVLDVLDEVVISAEVGVAKPDERIYLLAAERMGAEPRSCIFVDDVAENVEAAGRVGMIGIQHAATAVTLDAVSRLLGVPG